MSADNKVAIAEIQLMRAHLKHRALICIGMIVSGVICLLASIVMLAVGLKAHQLVWLESGSLKITAGGFGAVNMAASVAWGYVAFRSRPRILRRPLPGTC